MCNILPLCTICYKNKQNLWLHLLRNRAIINAMQLDLIRIFLDFSHVLRKRSGKFAERKGEHYENWSNRTQLYPRCRFCDELSEGTGLLSVPFGKIPCTIFVEREKVAFGKEYNFLFHPAHCLPLCCGKRHLYRRLVLLQHDTGGGTRPAKRGHAL